MLSIFTDGHVVDLQQEARAAGSGGGWGLLQDESNSRVPAISIANQYPINPQLWLVVHAFASRQKK